LKTILVEHTGGPVLVEHTGDPALYPQCERVMHQPGALAPPGARELELAGYRRTACGVAIEFWFLGEPREQTGWNWCPTCFPGRKPRSFFREYSLINKAWAMVRAERGAIAQQERLLPPRKRHEDEKTRLARVELANKKVRVDRAEALSQRARLIIDRQRVNEISDTAHPAVIAALQELDSFTSGQLDETESRIDEQEEHLKREREREPTPHEPTPRRARPALKSNAYCYCPKCAGGLPPRQETIRQIRHITRRNSKP